MAPSLTISSCTFIYSVLNSRSARLVTGASGCFGLLVLKHYHTAWLQGVRKPQSVRWPGRICWLCRPRPACSGAPAFWTP